MEYKFTFNYCQSDNQLSQKELDDLFFYIIFLLEND